jgi:uncharacterized protein
MQPHAPPEVLAFAECWDAARFFDAHEALEPAWMLDRDPGLHGLIQLAVALHHLSRGNLGGARRMVESGLAHLANPARKPCDAIDVAAMARYGERLRAEMGTADADRLIDARPRLRA